MTALSFEVLGAEAHSTAAAPTVSFRLRVHEQHGEPVHAIALSVQVQIEPRKRHYSPAEERGMVELFGDASRWGETLHTVLWTHLSAAIPSFAGETTVDLPAPCSYDFDVAANKYFDALESGTIPLLFLFSGTIFTVSDRGLQVARIPWNLEASYRLPVAVYRAAMDRHFPNTAWIRMRKDLFDQLYRFKTDGFHPTWDHALEALLGSAAATGAEGRRPGC